MSDPILRRKEVMRRLKISLPEKTRKNSAREQLDRIEDALIESILGASEAELREEMTERGEDPDKSILRMEQIIKDWERVP